jgi:GWxTD domain-containing protein
MAGFSLYTHAFLDPDQRPSILVNINVPYTSLIFLRETGTFRSDYAVYLKVLNNKKKLVETAVINESVVVEDYKSTRSAKMSTKSSKRFQLEPGEYIVKCAVQVKNTRRYFEREVEIKVPKFLEAGIGVGKPRLYATEIETGRYVPVLAPADSYPLLDQLEKESTLFAELTKHPIIKFDVYTEKETADSVDCTLYFAVGDEDDKMVAYGRRTVRIAGLRNQFVVYLNTDEWDPGEYKFVVKALQNKPERETTSIFDFTLGYSRSMLTRHIDDTIAILSLIATNPELDEIRNAPEGERAKAWAMFWARRDPSPGTEENEALTEHLRRLRYATENYAEGQEGWKTDRGKIYIRFGEPDHTEIKIDSQSQGEYLVWYYYKENLTFVFFDRFGLGEYRLTDSSGY